MDGLEGSERKVQKHRLEWAESSWLGAFINNVVGSPGGRGFKVKYT